MRRYLLPSLLGCLLTTSAALLLVGHNLLFHYNFNGRQPKDDLLYPGIVHFRHGGIRSTGALCEKSFSSPNGDGTPQEKGGEWSVEENIRTRNTHADLYYEKHGRLPLPRTMHKVLTNQDECVDDPFEKRKGVLVIGDVHGCFEELLMLHEAAVEANDNTPFRFVVLVGDMCNKGPHSAQVIRFVRQQKNWFAVRGNHDNAALGAALGQEWRRESANYQWVMEGEGLARPPTDKVLLSDEDVIWLSELPYTITIPASLFDGNEEDVDTVVVHAGFIPGVSVERQEIADMVHLRDIVEVYSSFDSPDEATGERPIRYAHHRKHKPARNPLLRAESQGEPLPLPWAAIWKGPQRVIFGHDAKRGFQRYNGDWVFGLDTGACYGKQLTGIILPDKRIVSVDSIAEHCTIAKKRIKRIKRAIPKST